MLQAALALGVLAEQVLLAHQIQVTAVLVVLPVLTLVVQAVLA